MCFCMGCPVHSYHLAIRDYEFGVQNLYTEMYSVVSRMTNSICAE